MASLEQRLADLEQAGDEDANRVIIYVIGAELPELPPGDGTFILLPDNGRDDQEATRV